MAQKILIIEDEEGIIHLLNLYLKDAGYSVIAAHDAADGLALHAREKPDLVILDIMLPGLDGFEVCRRIRSWSSTPILILTARGDEDDRIRGLDLGADDYLVKPFSPRELVSRVRAILRRTSGGGSEGGGGQEKRESEVLRFPGLVIDLPARRVEVDGREVALTPTEFDLLALLARSPDRVFTREMLMNKVWGYDYLGDGHIIDVHISALRKKIETNAERRYIKTVWRVGYKFDAAGALKGTR
ncbi:MAG: response regulator transcription factor [Thermogemmatispora sp.]|jgi:DNA-binding response OmpR family regulator|uniref:DNA-binding response regulator n=1 Tax=Thermogemmatispora aurantia TaxID=2045279 RepID=A0A5J4K8N3_9CHLR|nr:MULTISPECIES: response regulator transcription factor [Thermogemmatispora]MBE3565740.1 response regulator transcription factor [Thermogemmatispora sp.]GER84974.1 DNA-binding response regulator [Thermogemmatispora aurantia]